MDLDSAPPLRIGDPIVILGIGRLGLHLASHLRQAGASALTLWNRTSLAPERKLFSAEPELDRPTPIEEGSLPRAALERARLVLITVADDALIPFAIRLAQEAPPGPNATLLHCSGALSSDVLEPLAARGNPTGSLHPLQSFSGAPQPHEMEAVFFATEGHAAALVDAEQIVSWLKGTLVRLSPNGKTQYHIAAVLASNLLVALISLACDAMTQATSPNLSREESLKLLLPLLEGTVENLKQERLPGALTGPISRGDLDVVSQHLRTLAHASAQKGSVLGRETEPVYRLLSQHALELARGQGLSDDVSQALQRLLRSPSSRRQR